MPKHLPGRLSIWYSKREGDVMYDWDSPAHRADAHLLHNALGAERYNPLAQPGERKLEPSIFKELEKRGYDLTTLRFSIDKKKLPTDEAAGEGVQGE